MQSAPDLRRDIERFLAMGGGSFGLLLDMAGERQPPETTMATFSPSQTPERRPLPGRLRRKGE